MRNKILLVLLCLLCAGCNKGTDTPDFITVMTQTGQVIGTHETDDYYFNYGYIVITEGDKRFVYMNAIVDVEGR